MDIRHLEYFSEVAKHLSFTKAAYTLHVTQPSISKAIKQIEEELDVTLFYRSKQLELTDAGKAVLVNTKHVLEAFHNLTTELTDTFELKKGEVKIGIPPIVGPTFFSKLISKYKEMYPSVKLVLTEVGSKKIKEGVEDGSLDIGLICNLPINNGRFETMNVIHDPLMLMVHKQNPLANETTVDLADLKDEHFILYQQDFTLHDRIVEECYSKGYNPKVVCHSSQKDFMMEMVEAKLGVALLPSRIAKSIQNSNIAAVNLTNSNVCLELGLIWRKDKYLSYAVRELISMSEEIIEVNDYKET
ncbi:LysR family transcriptional regulator [Metabacillus halosaccharovorans]|uniref:LysR family transcriptional regulator n=1 Tax=Metabacillus halosaccharovorans TaxID=930124 RepID=UPI001C201101|nr:LysR family transcriptional regulator [Metabacillus halosaccharovorans]MBU7591100.1 LysR family transcriptional regulator [Metabacillus halosaccharovorans]